MYHVEDITDGALPRSSAELTALALWPVLKILDFGDKQSPHVPLQCSLALIK